MLAIDFALREAVSADWLRQAAKFQERTQVTNAAVVGLNEDQVGGREYPVQDGQAWILFNKLAEGAVRGARAMAENRKLTIKAGGPSITDRGTLAHSR